MAKQVKLEPEAQQFVEETANPPFLYQLGPEKGRKKVDEVLWTSPTSKWRNAKCPAALTGRCR